MCTVHNGRVLFMGAATVHNGRVLSTGSITVMATVTCEREPGIPE
jgi:hypothetical protein